ncbi:Hypothetical predicted protein [Olea europaea subsp. europaea]|uniref:Uncharacterized protein n=1 Tax=Olea europaea subsp. europaea TaxID=158383 RepID=A0A8S0SYJ9_OLEEU|nr:Hypothetical predicted protein [Olea europaea subsp. europaea]
MSPALQPRFMASSTSAAPSRMSSLEIFWWWYGGGCAADFREGSAHVARTAATIYGLIYFSSSILHVEFRNFLVVMEMEMVMVILGTGGDRGTNRDVGEIVVAFDSTA